MRHAAPLWIAALPAVLLVATPAVGNADRPPGPASDPKPSSEDDGGDDSGWTLRRHLTMGFSMGYSFWDDLGDLTAAGPAAEAGDLHRWSRHGLAFHFWIELSPFEVPGGSISVVGHFNYSSHRNEERFTAGRNLTTGEEIKAAYNAEVTHLAVGLEYHFLLYRHRPEWESHYAADLELFVGAGYGNYRLKVYTEAEDEEAPSFIPQDYISHSDRRSAPWFSFGGQFTAFIRHGEGNGALAVGLRVETQFHMVKFDVDEISTSRNVGGPQVITLFGIYVGI